MRQEKHSVKIDGESTNTRSGEGTISRAIDRNLEEKIEEEVSQLEKSQLGELQKEAEKGSEIAKIKIELRSVLDNSSFFEEKIEWFRSDEENFGISEITRKIDNNQSLKRTSAIVGEEIAELREKFNEAAKELLLKLNSCDAEKSKFIEANSVKEDDFYCFDANPDDQKDWQNRCKLESFKGIFKESADGKELVRKLFEEKLTSLEEELTKSCSNKAKKLDELKKFYSSESYPIVWITVGEKTKDDEEKIDDFKYGSKKLEKEVYKPYSKIHRSLIDTNWAIRNGDDLSGINYITAHILFVVSDEPHQKNDDGKYDGRRTHIDFPINVEWEGNWQEEGESGASTKGRGVAIRASKDHSSRPHSEESLAEFLKNEEKVKNIVKILKEKLQRKFGSSEGFKVYEVNLFLNSNHNICENCEQILKDLQSSERDQSFLKLLKSQIEEQGLKTLTKQGFPRMIISASAYKVFNFFKIKKVEQRTRKALSEGQCEADLSKISIDTKPLSRKAILSTGEAEIYSSNSSETDTSYLDSRKRKAEVDLEERGVPFHSAFTSSSERGDLLSEKRAKYQPPESFDGIDNLPSKSPMARSSELVVLEKKNFISHA